MLELRLGLGKGAIAAVQVLYLALKLEVLLCQTGLQVVQVLVLAGKVVVLGLQSSHLVLGSLSFALGVSLHIIKPG